MRQYLAAHPLELEVVEVPEAHTNESISHEWKVLRAQVAKTLTLRVGEDAMAQIVRTPEEDIHDHNTSCR